MKVILKQDYISLGYKHDVVVVKDGYGRNFLIPKGIGMIANDSNLKVRAENIRQAEHKQSAIRAAAQKIADAVAALKLVFKAKAGENGRIFGTITHQQIADALTAKGIEVDRRKITFGSDIKTLGEFEATLDIHREIKPILKFEVVAE